MKILITGAAGFLAKDVITALLENGHDLIGIDNFSKYKEKNSKSPIQIIEGDARDEELLLRHLKNVDCFIPMAAMVGGIDYFHNNPFTIMSYNDHLTQSAFSAAIKMNVSRMLLISSSMVFENVSEDLMLEKSLTGVAAPSSSYGFQKLNLEKYAEFAWRQHKLQCEIIRPFNGVGIGELQDLNESWPKVKNGEATHLHVIPELILKCLLMKDNIEIYGDGEQIRCFTSSKDIALGVNKILSRRFDELRYYHLSSSNPITIFELAHLILEVVRPNEIVEIKTGMTYEWDVKKRIPQTHITKELLNFETTLGLKEMIEELHYHILKQDIYV